MASHARPLLSIGSSFHTAIANSPVLSLEEAQPFRTLHETLDHGFTHQQFGEDWQKIRENYLSAQALTEIPHLIASALQERDIFIRRRIAQRMVHDLPSWEEPVLAHIEDGKFSTAQFIAARESFAKLGIVLSPDFQQAYERNIIAAMNAYKLTPEQLAMSLHTYATTAELPSEAYWTAFRKNAIAALRKGEFSNYAPLISVVHSCAILNACGEDKFSKAIAVNFYREMPKYRLHNPYLIRKADQACLWLDLPFHLNAAREMDSPSKLEFDVQNLFEKAGYPYQAKSIDGLDHKVDLTFGGRHQNTMIEIDGIQHFLLAHNSEQEKCVMCGFNGETILQSALITKMMINAVLLRLPFQVADAAWRMKPDTQQAFADFMMSAGRTNAPGAYLIACNKGKGLQVVPLAPGVML